MLHVSSTKSVHIPPGKASRPKGTKHTPESKYQKILAISSKKEQPIQQASKVSKP